MKITEVTPTFASAHTRIWDITERTKGEETAPHSTVSLWVIHAPWMHFCWAYHLCGLIHLRDVEGTPPCKKQFPEATHEFMAWAINPAAVPEVDKMKVELLRPVSIVQQFTAAHDAAAFEKIEHMMTHVVQGELSVDSDFRSTWRLLLRGRAGL